MPRFHRLSRSLFLFFCLLHLCACSAGIRSVKGDSGFAALAAGEIGKLQEQVNTRPIADRIVFWAEQFINTPYDTDPLGEYVRSEKVVCDPRVDCMYLVFRAVELAQANTPEGATDRALDLRFRTRGRIERGRVVNYNERFEYAEDMIASGRWGRDVTEEVGNTLSIPGTQGHDAVTILPKNELLRMENLGKLKSGDLIFFVKDPAKRVVSEVIGHLGIIKVENGTHWLIHASGTKASADGAGGGLVKKVGLVDYFSSMNFIGVKFTRFE